MSFNLPDFFSNTNNIARRKEVDKMVDKFWHEFSQPFYTTFSEYLSTGLPKLNISETNDKYFIEAVVPGMEQKDLDLSLENNILTIKGHAKEEKESSEKNYYVQEWKFSSFQRSITLPANVNESDIKASFIDGILKLEITKKEKSKAKKIEIK